MEETKSVFNTLNDINVSKFVEVKDNGFTKLTYLSWASAYEVLMENYPEATYEIVHWEGKPYLYDEDLGYLVETRMTINGQTKEMWLPVMDSSNKAMKNHPYQYKTKKGDRTVEAATMFDINTSIMRCLVKNIGVFGLGLYIYKGEDLPTTEADEKEKYVKASARFKKICADKKLDIKKTMVDNNITRESSADFIEAICDKLEGKNAEVTENK